MHIKEKTLEETLKFLETERNDVFGSDDKNLYKLMNTIDVLIEKTNLLINEPLEDKILMGSFVTVEIDYGDGDVEQTKVYLGDGFESDTISIYSPLGLAIFGKSVGETITYSVRDIILSARIVSKGVEPEALINEKGLQLTNN